MIAREALREERPQEVLMQMKSHRGEAERLLQELLYLFDPGADALLVHAGRARQADAADRVAADLDRHAAIDRDHARQRGLLAPHRPGLHLLQEGLGGHPEGARGVGLAARVQEDRKSTRLNSSHGYISYAVFCLKKKKHTHDYTYIAS